MRLGHLLAVFVLMACEPPNTQTAEVARLLPAYVTDSVNYDSDDPAIWINFEDPSSSLILGTDKMENERGGIFVFDLKGRETHRIEGVDRPNNIDVAYGLKLDSARSIDIAVYTERVKEQIRVISLPDMEHIDGGGIPVFEDSDNRLVMGVALYKRAADDNIFAIVSRKGENAPLDGYLYQYLLYAENDKVRGKLVRKFGQFSGAGEIEAVAVDNQLGFVYYSDEGFAIRKYHADPSLGNEELAQFGKDGFREDREGISIYPVGEKKGYILVSDQQARAFRVFPREGTSANPHDHPLLAVIPVNTFESDGSEVVNFNFKEDFPAGFFVAMSDNRTFEIYDWQNIYQVIQEQIENKKIQ